MTSIYQSNDEYKSNDKHRGEVAVYCEVETKENAITVK